MKRFVVAALCAVFLFGCQDHHFVPIEKADKAKLPDPSKGGGITFGEETETDKFVKTEAYRGDRTPDDAKPSQTLDNNSSIGTIPEGGHRTVAQGVLELGEAVAGKVLDGYTVFIIAWNADKPGPPVAVWVDKKPSFPLSFNIEENDLMVGEFPDKGMNLIIEARLDKDGDVMSKKAGDYYGITEYLVSLGQTGLNIKIAKERNESKSPH